LERGEEEKKKREGKRRASRDKGRKREAPFFVAGSSRSIVIAGKRAPITDWGCTVVEC
jgi:hypothetical protein